MRPWPKCRPPFASWPGAGTYQLWIRLRRPVVLRIGRLGRVALPAGVYVYTGRAARALQARVRRHVTGGRRRHWHIDYLLAAPAARLVQVVLVSPDPADECRANVELARRGQCPVPRFGASDCRQGCPAHLWRV
jgi:Uri superfamily endonuclease